MESKDEKSDEDLGSLLDWNERTLAEDTLICECYCVSVLDIRRACAETRSVDIELLKVNFGLGTGCGQCIKDLASWKNLIFD